MGFHDILAVAARIKEGPTQVPGLQPTKDLMSGPILAFGATDRGLRRSHNEDAFLMDDARHVYLLADGMGGALGGEVASQMAVRHVLDTLAAQSGLRGHEVVDATRHPLFTSFPQAVEAANLAIFERADLEPNLKGMGTTFTGMTFDGDRAFLAHVGDSRAYRVRGKGIEQLSEDHTYVNAMIAAGLLKPNEPVTGALHHVLARAVGVAEDVEVDVRAMATQPGDIFVLCSDGLANVVSADEIRDAVLDTHLRGAPDRLIRLANQRGGPDNITVIVLCVNETEANDGDHATSRSA